VSDRDWIQLLVGALLTAAMYSSGVTWAIRNRPTFQQTKAQINEALAASPYAHDQKMIEEKLRQIDAHILRLEQKIDDTMTLVQYPRPKGPEGS